MSRLMFRLTAASALAVMTLSMPLASYLYVGTPALAKDSGGGHGGGNGGGHGGGNGGNHGGGNGGHDAGHSGQGSKGKSEAAKSRSAESDDDAEADTDDSTHTGKSGKSLGALNAAHASATARAHAAPNSAVGRIAAYERERDEALAMTDEAERDAALDDAVADLEDAFGRKLSETQIAEINALLDRD